MVEGSWQQDRTCSTAPSPARCWKSARTAAARSVTPPPAGYRAIRPLCRSNLATLAGVILFDERKVQYLRRDDEAYIPEPESLRSILVLGMDTSLTMILPTRLLLPRATW